MIEEETVPPPVSEPRTLEPTLPPQPNLIRETARTAFLEMTRFCLWPKAKQEKLKDGGGGLAPAVAVVEELASGPLPMFQEQWKAGRKLHDAGPHRASPFSGVPINAKIVWRREVLGITPEIRELGDQVFDWAERWHLTAEWVLERALNTLASWCEYPKTRRELKWAPMEYAFVMPRSTYGFRPWFGDEAFSAYKRQTRKEVKDQLDQYFNSVEEQASSAGIPLEHLRSQAKSYQWAVRAQVLDEPISRIALASAVQPNAVDSSVKNLVGFIGLPPRRLKPGRPKGAADTHRARSSSR